MALSSRLSWYAARARAMSPAELAWRTGSRVATATAPFGRDLPLLATPQTLNEAFHGFREATDRPVLLDASRAADIASACPDDVRAVVAAADEVARGRFAFFGGRTVEYADGAIDWNLDPRTGLRWPSARSESIDHRVHHGDPKWIWELNRLQHLVWLAQAWLFTGDERYADTAFAHLDSWRAQNPPGRGIVWRGGFEPGIRALSIAVALQGLRAAPGLTEARYERCLSILAESARRAWRQRSLFSSANNHLLGEMAGVVTVGLLHPEIAGARRAATQALDVLATHAERQILPDGAGAEQSTAYQMFAVELLLLPAALLRSGRVDPPAALVDAMARSSRFLGTLVAGGDPVPRYGDDDGGFALRLHADPAPSSRRHLAAVDTFLGNASMPDLPARWLSPDASALAPNGPSSHTLPDLYAPDGGLVVLRRGGRRVTMDVGRLGYLALAAHGHADALSVTVTVDGTEVIGDPGTGSYYAEPAWRQAFRGTAMHPTATVDDLDQSVSGGAFLWTRHATTTVRAVHLDRALVEAEHDGYLRLPEPVAHRRYLLLPSAEDVVVVDLFAGAGEHRFQVGWPLHPDVMAEAEGGRIRVLLDSRAVLTLSSAATHDFDTFTVRGDESRRLGWWSDGFEAWRPAPLVGAVIDARIEESAPLAIATLLGPEADRLALTRTGDQLRVRWTRGSSEHTVRIDTATPGAVSYEHTPADERMH